MSEVPLYRLDLHVEAHDLNHLVDRMRTAQEEPSPLPRTTVFL